MIEKPIEPTLRCKTTRRLSALLYPLIYVAILFLAISYPVNLLAGKTPLFSDSKIPSDNHRTNTSLNKVKNRDNIVRRFTISPNITVNAGADQNLAANATQTNLAGTLGGASTGPNDTVNLVLIQGESNAAGMALNTQATVSELLPRNNVKIINNNTLQFEALQLGINNNLLENVGALITHGMENGLANEVDAGRLTQPTYLVKAGGSGSWISEWLSNGSSRNASEYSWAQLVGRMDAAVNYLTSRGIHYKITVWQSIGINDYNAGTSNAAYQSQMQQFRSDFRSRYGQNIPFYTTHFFAGHPYNAVIDAIAASDPLGICSAIDITGATYKDPNIHWDHDGLNLIASRMVDKMVASATTTQATVAWTKVSGPAGGNITAPNNLNTTVTGLQAGTYVFRLTASVNSTVAGFDDVTIVVPTASGNVAPIANAGANINITLPANSTTLNGSASSDSDGTIATYTWSKISGPSQFNITNAASATTTLTNLVQGVYSFKLLVQDNGGLTASATVNVTVNAAPPPSNKSPIANAGADITITLPTNTATLNGSGSSDPDGTIVSYGWSKLSGPAQFSIANATAVSTGLSNLAQGVYTFKLQVTDNSGGTGADTIKVTVNAAPTGNQAPVANAGADITITLPVNTATLDGSASSDPDGTIAAYSWTKVSGPAQFSIASASAASTQVNNLVQGVYTFKLQILDNSGATASDNVTVTVNAAGSSNVAPIANAGPDVSLTLPSNTASLDGSASKDPDGTISKYSWNKLSGPGTVTISNSTSAVPSVAGLSAGQYVFELSVTDNKGATSKDQVNVIINQAAPVADAGNDTTVSLPATKISLKGHKSKDPNGAGITNYSWKQVSGPTSSVIATPGVVTTEVSNLTVGEYVYELTVTNKAGISSSATVKVDVVNNFRYTEFFKLYPNPAAGFLNVEYISDVTGNMNAVIYDVKGSQIFNEQYAKNQSMLKKQIDVSKLKPGMYYLQVAQSDGTKFVRPFVKQ